MSKVKKFIFLILIIAYPLSYLHSTENYLIPDSFVSQFAGYIGFLSVGVGYEINETVQTEFLYGFVPSSLAGIDIHLVTARAIISPVIITILPGYYFYPLSFGFFINYAIGEQYHVKWPEKYPERYYRPNAIFTGESLGLRLKKEYSGEIIKGFEFFIDLVTMTFFLYDYIQNEDIESMDIVSLGFGTRLYF